MKKRIKETSCIIFIIIAMTFALAGCSNPAKVETGSTRAVSKETAGQETDSSAIKAAVSAIKKHGNVVLDINIDGMKEKGIDVGDIITVRVGEKTYELPVSTDYTDVDSGSMVCRFDQDKNEVVLGINMGSFAEETGIAEKQTIDEDPGYKWNIFISDLELSLKEKAGYKDEYNARHLERSNNREDYPKLSDEEFANFRAVSVTGMKENTLYRSSTPIDTDLGRNEYAMAATEKAGVRTIINLTDSEEAMKNSSTYPGSYYSTCSILNPEMNYEFETEEFAEKVKASILFMTQNEAPYLIHCKEGKDRTGILCAILECFAGASAAEVREDYMITYYNFFNVTPGDAAYNIVLKNNIEKTLGKLFKVDNLETADLKESAKQYLLSIGLTENQLQALSEILVK